jgi:hypothetical protein
MKILLNEKTIQGKQAFFPVFMPSVNSKDQDLEQPKTIKNKGETDE